LVLEVKAISPQRKTSSTVNRGEDFIEISLDSEYRYNPLHNDLDAYA
jgi:hypothetical protein